MAWPLQRECNKFFGNPRGADSGASAAWEKANLVLVPCPWRLLYAGKPVRGLRVHKKCAESLTRVLAAIWVRFGRSQAAIEKVRMHVYGGGYNFRLMRGGSNLSMHSWGCALDFDPEHNGLGNRSPTMDRRVIEEFEREGWEWGGHWSRTDGMHFQAAWTSASPPRLRPVVQPAKLVEEPDADAVDEVDPADAGAPETQEDDPAVVIHVQQRLRTLGYYGVGKADGDMAALTRGAIVAFKHDSGLAPETPEIDPGFLTALAGATPRPVRDVTAEDLRERGSETISLTDKLKGWGKWLLGLVGLGGLAEGGGAAGGASSGLSWLSSAKGFLNEWGVGLGTLAIVAVVAIAIFYLAKQLENHRVHEAKIGKNI